MSIFKDKQKDKSAESEAFLMTVNNNMELGIIEGILRSEHIIYLVKSNGVDRSGNYLGGINPAGIDIYVSQEDLQRAKDAVHKSEGLLTDE